MADKKISALTAASTPLAGTEVLPIVQSGATVKVAVSDLTAGRAISTTLLTISGAGTIEQNGGTGGLYFRNTAVSAGATNQRFYTTDAAGAAQLQLLMAGGATPTNDIYGNLNAVTGNFVVGTSGKGIDFSATSGSGTSELLADYEEGTWTPVDSSGASLSLTITGTSTYTKIGRQVIATADITYPVTVSASLTLIGGLPFTSATGPSGAASIAYTDYGTWITASPGSANTSFRYIGAGGFLTNANLSGKRVVVTVIYIV
jgi:hypothetical protein